MLFTMNQQYMVLIDNPLEHNLRHMNKTHWTCSAFNT